MISPEVVIVALNILLTAAAYFVVYPMFVGDNIHKLATYDLGVSALSVVFAGMLYWNSGVQFSVLIGEVNWFWFTLIMYGLLETPLMIGYMKARGMSFSSLD